MLQMKNYVKGLAALAILASAGGLLFAQATTALTAKLDFGFVAGGKTFAAGRYEIRHSDPTTNMLTLRNVDTGKTEMVPFVTRLGPREGAKSVFVFDKEGSQVTLTEIHPFGADGYLLKGAAGKHTHETVQATQ
jgi:hypothetical protein